MSWTDVEFYQVTEVPSVDRREQQPESGQRREAPEHPDGALLAALGAATRPCWPLAGRRRPC
ncbi:hypothetical protein [Plantactinospora sp. KBS50]|uniref:hypothetical protein n=1 Tax=Plantactinospora sp. KBS50 TaxID=2024580 RepID=UPI000BAAFC46|nr:hypothetical protein [Plantactinospora sp. KBS50]ASW54944.1 hypothetical protein CIK06_13230 [Plantactinospora sp. KBS50]